MSDDVRRPDDGAPATPPAGPGPAQAPRQADPEATAPMPRPADSEATAQIPRPGDPEATAPVPRPGVGATAPMAGTPAPDSTAVLPPIVGRAGVPPRGPVPVEEYAEPEPEPDRSGRWAVILAAVAAVVVLLSALGVWWALTSEKDSGKPGLPVASGSPTAGPTPSESPPPSPSPSPSQPATSGPANAVVMPDVIGADEQTARLKIQQAGLVPVVVHESRSDQPGGRVFETVPAAGSSVLRGNRVEVHVAVRPSPTKTVPSVLGQTVREAAAHLTEEGIRQEPAPGSAQDSGEVILTAKRNLTPNG